MRLRRTNALKKAMTSSLSLLLRDMGKLVGQTVSYLTLIGQTVLQKDNTELKTLYIDQRGRITSIAFHEREVLVKARGGLNIK